MLPLFLQHSKSNLHLDSGTIELINSMSICWFERLKSDFSVKNKNDV